MADNQNQTVNVMASNVVTPMKARAKKELIEIPVNTQVSPKSASKAAKRFSGSPSPKKKHTIEGIKKKLQSADERREKVNLDKGDNKQKMKRVAKNQEELARSKKEAADAKAKKLATADANRDTITDGRAKKAAEHVSRAKEVCVSIKKAEQAAYKNKREAIDSSLQKATENRDNILDKKKQAAADHVDHVHDTIAQKGKEERERKASLDQKMKDAEARRHVAETNKSMKPSRKASAAVTGRAKVVINVDTSGDLAAKCTTKAKERLEAQSNTNATNSTNLSREDVENKLKSAEERREKYLKQKKASPKTKKNAATFMENRDKIDTSRLEADELKAKRTAEAALKASRITEDKAKKAAEHCSKVKQVAASHHASAADKLASKKESLETKQHTAEARHHAQMQARKEQASIFNFKVGETAKTEGEKVKVKRREMEQKLKDAEARRSLQVAVKSPYKKKTTSPLKTTTKPGISTDSGNANSKVDEKRRPLTPNAVGEDCV